MTNKQFKIGKKTYKFKELTIQDYYDIQLLAVTDDSDSGFEVISKISGCPVNLLKGLSREDWLEVWIDSQNFIKDSMQEVKGKAEPVVRVNDRLYGLINLDKMTIGEFSDIDIITNSSNFEGKLHEAVAVLYRPLDKVMGIPYKLAEYDPDDFAQRAEEFKQFPLSQARISLGFFLTSVSTSLKATADSLVNQMKEAKWDPEKISEMERILNALPGIGTPLSTLSQGKIHLESTKPQSSIFGRLLTGWLGRQTKSENKNSKTKNKKQKLEDDNLN
jgi:hypothetical protein